MYIQLRIADSETCPDGRVSYGSETIVINCDHMDMAHGHQDHAHIMLASGLEFIVAETIEQVIHSIEQEEERYNGRS